VLNLDKIEKRYLEYWNKENQDRPILDIRAPKKNAKAQVPEFHGTIEERWLDTEYMVKSGRASVENTYFGALTSGFICGFSIASVLFGYWVTKWDPFKVVSVGLICWFLAAIMSGLAPNYWVLLIARMISGVGEAAFQIGKGQIISQQDLRHIGKGICQIVAHNTFKVACIMAGRQRAVSQK